MNFVRSVAVTFLSKGTIILLGMVSSIIVARELGPHDKGVLAAITALAGLIIQFGNLGLPNANTYFVAKERNLVPRLVRNSLWLSLILGGGLAIVGYLAAQKFPSLIGNAPLALLGIGLVGVPFMFFAPLAQNIILGLRWIRAYNIIDLLGNLTSALVTVILVVVFHVGVHALLLASTAVAIGVAVSYFVILFERRPAPTKPGLFREMIGYGLRSYLANLIGYMVIRSDLILVTIFLGDATTGVYSIAAFAVDILYLLATTTGTLFFPVATAHPDGHERDLLTAKIVRTLIPSMFLICLVGGAAAILLIPRLYGIAFAGAVVPTLILLPGIFLLSLETILMNNFASRGLPVTAILILGSGLGINVLANLFMIPHFGINGAALTSTIAYGLMFILATIYFRRLSKLSWSAVLAPRAADLYDLWRQLRKAAQGVA